MFGLPGLTHLTTYVNNLIFPLSLLDLLKNPGTKVEDAEDYVFEMLVTGKFELVDMYDTTRIESKGAMIGLLNAVAVYKELSCLDFSNTTFSDEAWEALLQNYHLVSGVITSLIFGKLPPARISGLGTIPASRLTTLRIGGIGEKPDMASLISLLNKQAGLNDLSLTGLSLRQGDLDQLLSEMNLRLTHLSLQDNLLGSTGLERLLPLLAEGKLSSLTHLNLIDNRITSLPPQFLESVILSNLKAVNLSHNRLPDKEFQDLFLGKISTKEMEINFYPQKVFPTPDYYRLHNQLEFYKIKTYVPHDVLEQRKQLIDPRMMAGLTNLLMLTKNISSAETCSPEMIDKLNKVFGNPDHLASWNDMLEFVLKVRFRVENVPADGNCLFEAVARQCKMPNEVVRVLVAYREYVNRDFYSAYFDGDHFSQHLKNVSKDKFWGGQLELAAMNELFKRPLIVFNPAFPLRLAGHALLPPEGCIHGALGDTAPIYLFNMISLIPPEERFPGRPLYNEYHYQGLFPKDKTRQECCFWPPHMEKPPRNDTLEKLFSDQNITVENAIIRLWPLLNFRTIRIENVLITSLNSVIALCQWLKNYLISVQLINVRFSPPVWKELLEGLNNAQSARSLRFHNITAEQLLELIQKCPAYISRLSLFDFRGDKVENPADFIDRLAALTSLINKPYILNLAGRQLGNGVLSIIGPNQDIDLSDNGITDLTALPVYPKEIDLSQNLIPAQNLIDFLKGKPPFAITTVLPQKVEYVESELTTIKGLTYESDDSDDECVIPCLNIPDTILQHFILLERLEGSEVWFFLSDLLDVKKGELQKSIVAYYLTNGRLKEWNEFAQNPEPDIEILFEPLSQIYHITIQVYGPDWELGKEPLKKFEYPSKKEPLLLYKDSQNVYYALKKNFS